MAEPPTRPPPRKLSAPRLPAIPPVMREDEPPSDPKLSSDSRELVLQRIRESEDRAKGAVEERIALYERQLAERDREIEALRSGDTTLHEAVEQLRAANIHIRAETQAIIASAVTTEVSKHFVSNEQADDKIKGAGRLTQVKSYAGAVIAALVASGALTQIMQSCHDPPKNPAKSVELVPKTPQPNPANYAGKP